MTRFDLPKVTQGSRASIRWRWIIVAAVVALANGCNRASPANMAMNPMAAPVYELADAVKHPKRLRDLFVTGFVPNDQQLKRFGDYAFQVSHIKSASDSEGVLEVMLDDGKADYPTEVEWSVNNEGGRWKLKTAPLP